MEKIIKSLVEQIEIEKIELDDKQKAFQELIYISDKNSEAYHAEYCRIEMAINTVVVRLRCLRQALSALYGSEFFNLYSPFEPETSYDRYIEYKK